LWIGGEDEIFAEEILIKYKTHYKNIVIGFGPSGGRSVLKQWPLDNFIELGRWLQETYKVTIVIIGGPGERLLGQEIESGLDLPVINLVGRTTLRQMGALFQHCHLFVGNDTGPTHIAAAVGVPVIALFGSSCPHRFGPWGDGHLVIWSRIPCSPCLQQGHPDRCGSCSFEQPYCMMDITVEQVKKAVERQLFDHEICTNAVTNTKDGEYEAY
jgi:heptosyltransferase-2